MMMTTPAADATHVSNRSSVKANRAVNAATPAVVMGLQEVTSMAMALVI
jgi:hypothetical protein